MRILLEIRGFPVTDGDGANDGRTLTEADVAVNFKR
jgi:hypothetical protein